MSDCATPLPIRSFPEACLYIHIASCPGCGRGPLTPDNPAPEYDRHRQLLTVSATCQACQWRSAIVFNATAVPPSENHPVTFQAWFAPATLPVLPPLNPIGDCSRLIDVAGWLTLFRILSEKARLAVADARTVRDRSVIRQLQIQAASCIEEALAFYDEDNDLPPSEALFSETSRRQFQERPGLFLKTRLIELRSGLPTPCGTMTTNNDNRLAEKPPWWRRITGR